MSDKQILSVAIVENGLCYCFDDNLCHYHEEIDSKTQRILSLHSALGEKTRRVEELEGFLKYFLSQEHMTFMECSQAEDLWSRAKALEGRKGGQT